MRVESLNIWGDHTHTNGLYKRLQEHLAAQAPEIDVFCLQEVFPPIYRDLVGILRGHRGYFSPAHDEEGLALFVKRDITDPFFSDTFVHVAGNVKGDELSPQSRNVQFVSFRYMDDPLSEDFLTIANFHGLWIERGHKDDTAERIDQSANLNSSWPKKAGPRILCGDFNLNPHTESLAMLEQGMDNLVKTHEVSTTRTHHYPWQAETPHASYMLVNGLEVVSFKVLPDVVSDHSPLVGEFRVSESPRIR